MKRKYTCSCFKQILQYKLEINRTIYYCGIHSHVSIVNGRKEYIQQLRVDACRRLYNTGSIVLSLTIINRIQRNTTNWRSVVLAETSVNGEYYGVTYTDSYGTT